MSVQTSTHAEAEQTSIYSGWWSPEWITEPTGDWTRGDQVVSSVQDREFAPSPYLRGGFLGSGGWGNVYKVLKISENRTFAGKAMKSPRAIEAFRDEATALQSLNHDHILKFVDWHEDQSNPMACLIITELCVGGTLKTQIDNSTYGFELAEILETVLQISSALEYLHSRNLFHCDVKPRNILIRTWKPVNVVLGDCADVTSSSLHGKPGGTEAYWSPHIAKYKNRSHGKSDDIWALGITLMGMMAQWPKLHPTKKDLRKYPQRCLSHAKKLKNMNPDHEIVDLLSQMLAWNPRRRASAGECVFQARRLLSSPPKEAAENVSTRNPLGLDVPYNFKPVSFW